MITQYTTPAKYTPIDYNASEDLWKAVAIKQEAYDKAIQELKDTQTFIDKIQTPSIKDREFLDKQSAAMRSLADKYVKEDLADRFVQAKMQSDLAQIQLGKIRAIEESSKGFDEYNKMKFQLEASNKFDPFLNTASPSEYSTIEKGVFKGTPEASYDYDKAYANAFEGIDFDEAYVEGNQIKHAVTDEQVKRIANENASRLSKTAIGDQLMRAKLMQQTGMTKEQYINLLGEDIETGEIDQEAGQQLYDKQASELMYNNLYAYGQKQRKKRVDVFNQSGVTKDEDSMYLPSGELEQVFDQAVSNTVTKTNPGKAASTISFVEKLAGEDKKLKTKNGDLLGYDLGRQAQINFTPASVTATDANMPQKKQLVSSFKKINKNISNIVSKIRNDADNATSLKSSDIAQSSIGGGMYSSLYLGTPKILAEAATASSQKAYDAMMSKPLTSEDIEDPKLLKLLNTKNIKNRKDLIGYSYNDIKKLKEEGAKIGLDLDNPLHVKEVMSYEVSEKLGKILKDNKIPLIYNKKTATADDANYHIINVGEGKNRVYEQGIGLINKEELEKALVKNGQDLDELIDEVGGRIVKKDDTEYVEFDNYIQLTKDMSVWQNIDLQSLQDKGFSKSNKLGVAHQNRWLGKKNNTRIQLN